MSDTVAQPTHKQERSLGAEIARTSAISAAANAAGITAVLGALVLFSKFSGKSKQTADNDTTLMESETTES